MAAVDAEAHQVKMLQQLAAERRRSVAIGDVFFGVGGTRLIGNFLSLAPHTSFTLPRPVRSPLLLCFLLSTYVASNLSHPTGCKLLQESPLLVLQSWRLHVQLARPEDCPTHTGPSSGTALLFPCTCCQWKGLHHMRVWGVMTSLVMSPRCKC